MTPYLLGAILAQGALLVLITCALAVAHRVGLARDARRARELDEGRRILRGLLDRRLLPEEAASRLDALDDWTLATLLHEEAARRQGEDFARVADVWRRTAWHDAIAPAARSSFWWRRLRAARALSALAGPEHLGLVHDLLDDATPAVRLAAALALERLPSPGLAAALLERAFRAPPVERAHLVEVLAESDSLVLPVMTERLRRPATESEVRVLLDLTARLGYTSLLPDVIRFADSDALEIRIAAANCLRHFPHPQTSSVLRRLLADPAWQVRSRAAASLGGIGAIEAIGALLEALRDPSWWVRLRAAVALRLLGPLGIEALRSVPGGSDRFASDMARYVLGLDDGALAEYAGGLTLDFAPAPAAALAS